MPQRQRVAPAELVGRVLAGHRIDALIGEGGMGVVYRATHLRLGRPVALKVLPPSLTADVEFRGRFEREAAIAASLEHPNVVPIYDAGHVEGVLYLSMRFVDGEDLGAVLRREGLLGIDRLCAVLGPVADALDAVHEAGLVHRDVKPGNVLLARAGQVYLCDFGIAKGTAYAGRDMTSAGRFMGTPQYSSPEQIEGRWLDGRSDQYGLACLAYRCLTGEVPYPRTEMAAVIYAHLAADPPRPSLLRPELPGAVDAALARAAAKRPDDRFATCADFLSTLRAAARPPARRPRPAPLPTPPSPTPATDRPRPGSEPVAAPTDVCARRDPDGRSITITWTAADPRDVEYKITRQTAGGRWHVVGRTHSACIVDGAVPPDSAVPVYAVVARLGPAVSEPTRSPAVPAPDADPSEPDAAPPGGIPAVRHLTVIAPGVLGFVWPSGITETMVVVRRDQPPIGPDDPACTSWKITNMRYQLDGGLRLPDSVELPCHVGVASCRRVGGDLVVAPGFDPSARVTVRA
jgi:serine/threonine protein kinase